MMRFCGLTRFLTNKPAFLFVVDGIGAVLSWSLLWTLAQYESFFGISRFLLFKLMIFPVCLMLYDLVCYFKIRINQVLSIQLLAFGNWSYCLVSLGVVITCFSGLT